MNWRFACRIALLCCLVVIVIAAVSDPAFAQKGMAAKAKGTGDKSLAERKGMEGLFQANKFSSSDPRAPTKLQGYAGLASIAVMIIVVKYL